MRTAREEPGMGLMIGVRCSPYMIYRQMEANLQSKKEHILLHTPQEALIQNLRINTAVYRSDVNEAVRV